MWYLIAQDNGLNIFFLYWFFNHVSEILNNNFQILLKKEKSINQPPLFVQRITLRIVFSYYDAIFPSLLSKPEWKLSKEMPFTVQGLKSNGLLQLLDWSPCHFMFTFLTSKPSMCSMMIPAELWLTSPWHPGL